MSESNNYKISIINKNKEKIERAENQSEMFLIIQNEELLNQNKQVIIDMKDLQSEKDEIDEWLDKSEKDKVHMKNFIKTILQTNSIITSIKDNYSSIMLCKAFLINTFMCLVGFNFLLMFLNIPRLAINLFQFSYIIVFVVCNKNEIKYYKNNEKYSKELSELEKNNDYLTDYVDNM